MDVKADKWEWYRRANESIAQGALTNSKRVECLVKGVSPTHIKKAEGCFVYDTEGKKYLDFICGLGTNLLGYANAHIQKAVVARLSSGWLGSLPFTSEVEAAELVKNWFPFVDRVRFLKEGTTACQSAIRIARAHTGRSRVLSHGYHGHADPFISLTPPSLGVPEDGNIETFSQWEQLDETVAAVIIEPIITEWGQERIMYLAQLREKCTKLGIVLIFDEIITGFRWPKFSFACWSGIHPDIILLGKACAGGMPLSIIGLGRGIGEGKEWFVSGTFHGDLLALAALTTTFELLINKHKIDDLWSEGDDFLKSFNELAPDKIKILGYPTRGVFTGDALFKALFWQEAARAGILFGPSFFLCFPHIEHLKSVLSFAQDIIPKIRQGKIELLGEMPASPFSAKARS